MNELEMTVTLGIVSDPDTNKLNLSSMAVQEDVRRVINVLNVFKEQKVKFDKILVERWSEFLPCHSMN